MSVRTKNTLILLTILASVVGLIFSVLTILKVEHARAAVRVNVKPCTGGCDDGDGPPVKTGAPPSGVTVGDAAPPPADDADQEADPDPAPDPTPQPTPQPAPAAPAVVAAPAATQTTTTTPRPETPPPPVTVTVIVPVVTQSTPPPPPPPPPVADLRLTVSATLLNHVAAWKLTATNQSNSEAATSVLILDHLQSGLGPSVPGASLPLKISSSQGQCHYDAWQSQIVCDLGTLQPRASLTVEVSEPLQGVAGFHVIDLNCNQQEPTPRDNEVKQGFGLVRKVIRRP